jgi:hypothetical protein
MFKKIEPLDPSKHQNFRLSIAQNFSFAGTTPSVKLSYSELRQAARYYPIIFQNASGSVPQALLSLEADNNAFIDDNNNWKVPYIPVFFRQYPFTLAKVADKENEFVLCIDPDAPHFGMGQGEPLFTADGKLTDLVTNILKGLQLYQKELAATETLFKKLDEKGLIVPRNYAIQTHTGIKNIEGFNGVDMEKLVGLDDAIIADFVRTGTMGFIYEHVNSFANMPMLVSNPPQPAQGLPS